jgi:hypothetical protein
MGVDLSSTYIYFFNENKVSSGNIDGRIVYNKGGTFVIDVSKNINLLAPISISNRADIQHINNETVVIYDISSGIFFKNIYNNPSAITGSSVSLIANDTSSNTFMNIITPNKVGLAIGGGTYPNDNRRSMGTIGLTDSSGNYTPSQMIVSGNNILNYRSTIGINTFKPRT